MKLAVFGASGKTGILIVFQALNQGHQVTAFSRKASQVHIQHKNLTVIEGDVLNFEKVKEAVADQDAILSALGVDINKPNTILSEGTAIILKAMEACGVKRFICMSSAGIHGYRGSFWFRWVITPLFLRHIFDDKKRQAKIVQESQADWVLIRPVGLTDAPKTNTYKVTEGDPTSSTIPRADVADFMLKLMKDNKWDKKMPAISSY